MDEAVMQKMFDAFAYLFLLAQRFEYMSNNSFDKTDLTTKQFLAIAAIEKGFDEAPSLGEVAEALSTSHQNTRQIVKHLQKRGFVIAEKDETDKRILRLRTTPASSKYFEERTDAHGKFINELFAGLSEKEISQFYDVLRKLLATTDDMYQSIRSRE